VAVRLVQSFYKMLFVDRFFHADPHPGNFLVEPQGPGASFRLDRPRFRRDLRGAPRAHRRHAQTSSRASSRSNDALVLKGFRAMGFVAEGGNDALLEKHREDLLRVKLLKIQDRTPAALLRAKPEQLERSPTPRSSAASCKS
jgi:ubiquinone biosynthesis protein